MNLKYLELAGLNNKDWTEFMTIVKKAQVLRLEAQKAVLKSGDLVTFTDKEGNRVKGSVVRVMIKNVKILTKANTYWHVSPNLLTLGHEA